MKASLYNQKGKEIGVIELSDSVFGNKVSKKVLSQYVYSYLSNQRESNANTKDRSEVSGGGKKPFKQKGTGRARAGSNRSPIWRGGGVTFGPTNERNYKKKMTKKFRASAFRSAFSYLKAEDKLRILDKVELTDTNAITKNAIEILNAFSNPKKVLIVTAIKNPFLLRAFANVKNVYVQTISKINVYDLLNYNLVLVEQEALSYIAKWESIKVKLK